MATFDLAVFVANPTLAQYRKCRKLELREIAEHYGVPVTASLNKGELKAAVLEYLEGGGIFCRSTVAESSSDEASSVGVSVSGERPVAEKAPVGAQAMPEAKLSPDSVFAHTPPAQDDRVEAAVSITFLLSLFQVYVGSSVFPVVVYTDHNPLVFLSTMFKSH